MKKLSFLSFLAIGMISLVSCAKDRVCTCTEGSNVEKVTYNDATKRQAKANCVSYTQDNGNGTSTKVVCALDK